MMVGWTGDGRKIPEKEGEMIVPVKFGRQYKQPAISVQISFHENASVCVYISVMSLLPYNFCFSRLKLCRAKSCIAATLVTWPTETCAA
jgi:hypothetical protein